MSLRSKIKETDLARLVIDWLVSQNWNVYQEVQFSSQGCVADIVAERHGILWVIETKTTYGFAVLEQATRWPVHYRSVAVPFARERDYRVAKYYYGVGVIEVFESSVEEIVEAPIFVKHRYTANHYRNQLQELHKTFAQAGSKGSQHLTPYKNTMIEVRKIVEKNPGCTVKFLYEQLGIMHYSSASSFKGNLLKSLMDFEKDWCSVDVSQKPFKIYIKSEPDKGL